MIASGSAVPTTHAVLLELCQALLAFSLQQCMVRWQWRGVQQQHTGTV